MSDKFITVPSTPIKDNESGLEADVKEVGGENALVTTGTFTGTVSTTPPTDRRFQTFILSGTETALVFTGFTIKGITITASQDNDGRVRIGETGLAGSLEYTILNPGENVAFELAATVNPVYAVFDTGTTSAQVHVVALGDTP